MKSDLGELSFATAAAPIVHKVDKYDFIDALRGYAVLLVIITHEGNEFADLPYPLKKLTNFGWHGVQLFFLMSCVTLLLSWRLDQAKGIANVAHFWTRRIMRIAPMYYLAGLLYFFVSPPPNGFQLPQALAVALFVNAWHPVVTPTVAHGWTVIPGSWSVSVEFTFYVLFPVFAALVGTWRRAVVVVVATVLLGCAMSMLAGQYLLSEYGTNATDNFLYFWFFNQFPVFALGAVLYHLFLAGWSAPQHPAVRLLHRHGTWVALLCVVLCIGMTEIALPARLPVKPPFFLPRLYLASAAFMVFALALGLKERSALDNAWIRSLGKVSFSAYLLHFGILIGLTALARTVSNAHPTGVHAIFAFAALLACTVPITHGLSWLTFRYIEQPAIKFGRTLVAQKRARAVRADRLTKLRQTA